MADLMWKINIIFPSEVIFRSIKTSLSQSILVHFDIYLFIPRRSLHAWLCLILLLPNKVDRYVLFCRKLLQLTINTQREHFEWRYKNDNDIKLMGFTSDQRSFAMKHEALWMLAATAYWPFNPYTYTVAFYLT